MKTYAFNQLDAAALAEVALIRHEPSHHALWDELGRRELEEADRAALQRIVAKLLYFRAQRANEATVWSRAIYPILMLAERDEVLAFSGVPLSATFGAVELRGEADGALALSVDDAPGAPYLVVVETKRGIAATDPLPQLLGAMLCAARRNDLAGRPAEELFGAYTIADVWTFVHGRFEWSRTPPEVSVAVSREYAEKTEAEPILAVLESIVARVSASGHTAA